MANDVSVEYTKLQKMLNNLENKLEKVCEKIVDEVAEQTLKEIQSNYSKAEYQAGGEEMDFAKTGSKTEKTVSMIGPQAWYSEFGTGTYGAMQPHPLKQKFPLNGYNSGETIRMATKGVSEKTGIPENTLYWTYKGLDGEIYYTQGIPAQKEVYDAGQTMKKEMPKIIEKYMKGMFE